MILFGLLIFAFSACRNQVNQPSGVAPSSLRDVPALRLNFRYEADVPAPDLTNEASQIEERNGLVQADFDQNRPQEILDMTVTSPDKQRVLAVFHNVTDVQNEYRLEMYSADGKSLKIITHEGMAVHFPETIRWAPDSSAVAFVAMARLAKTGGLVNENGETGDGAEPVPTVEATPESLPENTNTEAANAAPAETPQTGQPAAPVLTFRTEQIYLSDANGNDVKPVTQNEGLIYFYYVWSPDSSALAALAAKSTEWKIFQFQADQRGEMFRPAGRPRIVEKTGRQRLLDDYPTQVHPVWSPDSAKVAAAFDKQIRIYDAVGNAPTQAAILLRNQLLLSSKVYDDLNKPEAPVEPNSNANTNKNANTNVPADLPEGVLPDENSLVSFNPITKLFWSEETLLYFETAYVKEYKESVNNVRSNARWHRLVLSPQAVALGNQ